MINLREGKVEITQFDKDSRTKRINKFAGITEMAFNLNELDNTNNLENGSPSNTLLTYHLTSYEDSMHFKPYAPQYKKLNLSVAKGTGTHIGYQGGGGSADPSDIS